jgi:hypothetical protein
MARFDEDLITVGDPQRNRCGPRGRGQQPEHELELCRRLVVLLTHLQRRDPGPQQGVDLLHHRQGFERVKESQLILPMIARRRSPLADLSRRRSSLHLLEICS